MLYQSFKVVFLLPGLIILVLAAGLLLGRRPVGRALLLVGTLLLTLLSLPVVATLLMEPLEPYPVLDLKAALPPDVQGILILGAGIAETGADYDGPTLDRISLQRVRYGARLHRATGLPIYVTGGGMTATDPVVGEIMARALREEFGVPVAGVEGRSRTTWENAGYSKPMLVQDGISRVLLVSSAWHLPRAMAAFAWAGVDAVPAPTGAVSVPGWHSQIGLVDWLPSAGALSNSSYAIHEYLGRLWYGVRLWFQGAPHPPLAWSPVAGKVRSQAILASPNQGWP